MESADKRPNAPAFHPRLASVEKQKSLHLRRITLSALGGDTPPFRTSPEFAKAKPVHFPSARPRYFFALM
jgi:hypothetical protein